MTLTPKRSSESATETTHVVLPNDANPLGFILGGTVMHLIDMAGAIACHRHARTLLVTAAVDDLQFLHSIKVGDMIILRARRHCTCSPRRSGNCRSMCFSEEIADGQPSDDEPRVPDVRYVGDRPGRRDASAVPPLIVETEEERGASATKRAPGERSGCAGSQRSKVRSLSF